MVKIVIREEIRATSEGRTIHEALDNYLDAPQIWPTEIKERQLRVLEDGHERSLTEEEQTELRRRLLNPWEVPSASKKANTRGTRGNGRAVRNGSTRKAG
jgi:hypothetical protein